MVIRIGALPRLSAVRGLASLPCSVCLSLLLCVDCAGVVCSALEETSLCFVVSLWAVCGVCAAVVVSRSALFSLRFLFFFCLRLSLCCFHSFSF